MSGIKENKSSLVKKASYLKIAARDLAEGMKSGNFRSLYRGQGIEFSGVRDYIRGDDIRTIDWNVTARMGHPFVKIFNEERELQVFLIVDNSFSMQLNNGKKTKYEIAAEAAALVSIASEMNSCPLGAVFFGGQINFSCKPEFGRERTLLVLKNLENVPEENITGSVLPSAINGAGKLLKKRSMVMIFSDFRSDGWEDAIAQLAHKNDVIAFRIQNELDEKLPSLGTVCFEDCESGKKMRLPSSTSKLEKEWKLQNENRVKRFQEFCIRHGILPVILNTSDDPLQVLCSVFEKNSEAVK